MNLTRLSSHYKNPHESNQFLHLVFSSISSPSSIPLRNPQFSAMEASLTRSFTKCTNRHFLNTLLLPKHHHHHHHHQPALFFPIISQHTRLTTTTSFSNPNSHFPKFNLTTSTPFHSTPISANRFARILSGHNNDSSFQWKLALDGEFDAKLGFVGEDRRSVVTVVVLGWLGSKQKHLRRYAEMYNVFGMDAVTFAASVSDVLSFDLGRRIETRIAALTDELVAWLEEKEKDGRERFLIFHTFSNTGWLTYGSILNRLQGRPELLEKIKGCVVDSGGDPELDPKVWAAGFSTAMLKKQSSAVNSSPEPMETQNDATNANAYEKKPLFIEVLLLAFFEKFFAFLLEFPDVKKRLTKITSTLTKNQPFYPQLYLYSTTDKVIPSHRIESFADLQKKLGRNVTTFNFKSTPHVDHYRTFPDTYTSLIQDFLNQCFPKQLCTTIHKKQLS
ncbi:hypothetical protein OSB04_007150 [Centaurea solstitialis]|uniref:Transmembrane protein 53 n=1 Tax=Centaurea solstitialis TaxID=347529 RepID=A0AA38TJB9_9ASTR|nr:hypothetical protein OSB04_007150 [Centaurea solstitialis]